MDTTEKLKLLELSTTLSQLSYIQPSALRKIPLLLGKSL